MRLALAIIALAAPLLLAGEGRAQSAYDYPICAYYPGRMGGSACYYTSYAQCMATLSGIGGYCGPNPAYRARPSVGDSTTDGRGTPRKRARQH